MAQTLLIADDHPVVRESLRLVLRQTWPAVDVREAGTLEATEGLLITGFSPDLICLDLQMPGANGFSGLARVRSLTPRSKLVVLSSRDDQDAIDKARRLGANGYICKTEAMVDVAKSLQRILKGEKIFPLEKDATRNGSPVTGDIGLLTPAQTRVLMALTSGKNNKAIADELGLTEVTVKTHLSATFKKLQVSSRSQAMLVAQSSYA